MLASVANHLSARCFLWGPDRWELLDMYCQLDLGLFMALQLGGFGPLCSPDIMPSDIHLLGALERYLASTRFAVVTDVKQFRLSP
jgi:hypothetical protein